jgi:decaprenylphospho-beta-D-ribofuranose 2-oxidase
MDSVGKSLAVPQPRSRGELAPLTGPGGAKPYLTRLSGWGANTRADCDLRVPELESQIRASLDPGGTVPRGLGRSYGDAAINSDGRVLGMTSFNRYLAFDDASGALTCEAGVSLSDILRDFAPRGWMPMISPGTKFVTIGGCIANDIHGKAHHVQGSFSNSVDSFSVMLGSGEVVRASRTENSDLFWASFGGMGLLGVILTATIRLKKVETTFFRQRAIKVNDLDELLAAFAQYDKEFPYSVATLDVFATGARRDELPPALAADPLRVSGPPKLSVPFELPTLTLNRLSIRVVNAVVQQLQARGAAFSHYEGFTYPLDMLAHWNRGYGAAGFAQYQFVIPFEDGPRRLRNILSTILSSSELPFLNVLKCMGKQSEGLLSFPREGYTFAIDFPIRKRTAELLKRLDALVLDAGGRIYLGKDAFLDQATFRAMYPNLDQWLEIKEKYDPRGVFSSDLGRRVGLVR